MICLCYPQIGQIILDAAIIGIIVKFPVMVGKPAESNKVLPKLVVGIPGRGAVGALLDGIVGLPGVSDGEIVQDVPSIFPTTTPILINYLLLFNTHSDPDPWVFRNHVPAQCAEIVVEVSNDDVDLPF